MDERAVRLECLRLTIQSGIAMTERTKIASQYEAYVISGYSGEAKAKPEAPAAGGEDRPKRRTKRASEAPASSGEASDESEGDSDDLYIGRPSDRVAGVSLT